MSAHLQKSSSVLACATALLVFAMFARAKPSLARSSSNSNPQISAAFDQFYRLDFAGGRALIRNYERQSPEDPMGPAAEAAGYLFEEFNRQGVLTSQFFLNDKTLLGGVEHPPDEHLRTGFLSTIERARTLAAAQIQKDPRNASALLALTLSAGMQSDYEALIEKKQLASLRFMKEGEEDAAKLLAVDPGAGDAYVALGASEYIIGCMPAYKRALLWLGGIHGDRQQGMEQLRKAVKQGHYLKPFAKIMLALASLREGQPAQARDLYAELALEFPRNPIFPRELAFATSRAGGGKTCGVTPC